MKGLSDAIAAVFLIIIIISSLIPLIIMVSNQRDINSANQLNYENYKYFRDVYCQEINNGVIQISYYVYYNGQYEPQITFLENSEISIQPLYTLNITALFYLYKGSWNEIQYNYPIIVHLSPLPYTILLQSSSIPEPADIAMILNNGIIIFLAPNSTTV